MERCVEQNHGLTEGWLARMIELMKVEEKETSQMSAIRACARCTVQM